ncbi:MAG: hypothetical protein LUE64_02785, partial [Candidatus Gastranaerophilales bacterium]|nr:hypothetical protein [Candidatus Gastranaerophilales bacterium]
MDNTMNSKLQLFEQFLHDWSINRMQTINLEEYTNTNKTSFTYSIENGMRDLGSIKGVNSFIFGIYKRKEDNKEPRVSHKQYVYEDDYAWYKKYGDNKEAVFNVVKNNVNQVIDYAQKSDLAAIEQIDLPSIFKWKLAFHYQNKNDISIIPVFTRDPLQMYAQSVGIYKNNMTMADLYLAIKNEEKYVNLENAISLAEIIWDEFQNFSTPYEKVRIEHGNLTTSQKTNATSSLDYIEYEIKAYKIIRKNPHNHLEQSFYSFLNNIKAQNIRQDKTY